MKQIILASTSPRRKELLEKIGLKFKIVASNYEEKMDVKLKPKELAKYLSLQKAKCVAKEHKNAIVIAADTFIVFNDEILGKPKSEDDARKMLRKIQGKPHSVITGFTIISDGKAVSKAVETKIFVRKLNSKQIDKYIKSENLLDKAGSYAIQEGLGSIIVEKIEGDYYNVVGFPLIELTEELKKFGIDVL